MSAVEAMAKAYEAERELWFWLEPSENTFMQHWVCRQKDGEGRYTVEADDIHDETEAKFVCDKLREQASARAALLALAEAELPEGAVEDGAETYSEAFLAAMKADQETINRLKLNRQPGVALSQTLPPTFSAICRALANEGEPGGDKGHS